jgi:tRNA A37 N6-isopentenylltransferase MiaA
MLGLVGLLGIGFVASVIGGNLYLEKQTKKLNELKVEDKLVEAQQTALTQAKRDLEKYAELERIAKSVVPQDKDQAKAVLEVVEIARASNISIQSITFPSSNLGSRAAPSNNSAPGESGQSSQPQTSPISQAKPVDGIPGLYSLEMKISPQPSDPRQQINYYQLLNFLERIENNRRTAQITALQITPLSADRQSPFVRFSLTINIFVKP